MHGVLKHNDGYMEYGFTSLPVRERLHHSNAQRLFLYYYELFRKYEYLKHYDFEDLKRYLIDDFFLLMNNDFHRIRKEIFFRGNAVIVKREYMLTYLEAALSIRNDIVPLMIIPVKIVKGETIFPKQPKLMLASQEYPIFSLYIPQV